jgi:hypothetical protein
MRQHGQTHVMLVSKVVCKERRLTRVDSMCCCLTPKGDTYMHGLLVTNLMEVVHPFTATGPAEAKHLVDMITPLVIGTTKDPTDKRKQIFSECMHIATDNFFSGYDVLRYLWEGGWKGTITCRHDRLPKSVPSMLELSSRGTYIMYHLESLEYRVASQEYRYMQYLIAT